MPTVKGKIEKLLHELDLTDSGGVEAALASAAAAASGSSDFDDIMANLKAISDEAGGRQAADSDDDISVQTEDTDQGRPGTTRQKSSTQTDRFLYLERKALQLMSENKMLMLNLEQTTHSKDLQIQELQEHLSKVVRELEERQADIEAKAPLARLRTDVLRSQLQDLRISDARYAELKSMPPDNLHMIDEIKMSVYEETSKLQKDNERLRLGIATSKEAAARAEEEAARFRVESARLNSSMVEKEKELHLAAQGMQARVDRLASELESSMIRAELLSAKGQMYDELKARADKLQEDNHRLQVIEANFKRLDEQSRELQLFARDKEHTHEMLVNDKAYLAKQVELLSDVQRRLQSDLEVKESKINELQRQKQELFDKLVQTESLKSKQEDARLQRELSSLQTSTQASIERIRVETGEAYEREARLLRELRDQAQEEAARAKLAVTELQSQYEQHQLTAAELQRRLEGQVVELQTELKQKAFELSHLNVVVGEKEALLNRTSMQVELLQDKLQLSMDQYRALESDMRAAAAAGLPLHHSSSSPALSHGRPLGEAPLLLPSTDSRVQRDEAVVELTARLKSLEKEKEQLSARIAGLQAALQSAQDALRLAGQPHGFLLEQLQTAKAAAQQAETRAVAATAALKVKEQEASAAVAHRDALKHDLEQLLQQRGQLQGIKTLLIRTLGGAATAAPPGVAGLDPSTALRGSAPRPATTIIGEGA